MLNPRKPIIASALQVKHSQSTCHEHLHPTASLRSMTHTKKSPLDHLCCLLSSHQRCRPRRATCGVDNAMQPGPRVPGPSCTTEYQLVVRPRLSPCHPCAYASAQDLRFLKTACRAEQATHTASCCPAAATLRLHGFPRQHHTNIRSHTHALLPGNPPMNRSCIKNDNSICCNPSDQQNST